MNVEQIKNLDDLMGKTITTQKIARLTAPGENYGSLMLKVDILTSNNEEISLIAKMLPPNDFLQKLFNTQVTFRNEIAFYKSIVPLLQNFQKKHDQEVIDVFPTFYGGRLNLTNGPTVDADGVLLLENLKTLGYTTLDRLEGLGFEPAKLVLTSLAQFHAVPLALRKHKPEVFAEEIEPFLTKWTVTEHHHQRRKTTQDFILSKIPELKPLRDRIMAGIDFLNQTKEPREPFATIIHNDCWTNNVMFKVENGKLTKSKLVDFQIMEYGSPATDVLFFIFTSLKNDVIRDNFEELLKLYHGTFVATLAKLGCDVSRFNYEAFLREVDLEAKETVFGHLSYRLLLVYVPKEEAVDILEFTDNTMKLGKVTETHKEKYTFIYKEFEKRNWI